MEEDVEFITDPEEIRAIFNEAEYWEKAKNEEFLVAVSYQVHEVPDFLPECSWSCILEYFDGDEKVAVVHQYWPSRGRKLKPDPKMVKIEGVEYRLIRRA
jgi:hypothetical protein